MINDGRQAIDSPRLPAFQDILDTWNDEAVVQVTLTTGKVDTGWLTISWDRTVIWLAGDWEQIYDYDRKRYRKVLKNTDRERGYRVDHVIGVEYIADEQEAQ